MITANELRLGNLVLNRHGEIHEVNESTFQWFRYPTMDGDPAKLKGILLTPEILEKCGFINVFHYWTVSDAVKFKWYGGSMRRFVLTDNEIKEGRYLHELQNLYFALTGNELETNLIK